MHEETANGTVKTNGSLDDTTTGRNANGTVKTNGHLNGIPNKSMHVFPGPVANGKRTTVRLLNRPQLIDSGLLPQLQDLINVSFASQHARSTGILEGVPRLRHDDQLLEEMGHAPGTFVYIISTLPDSGAGENELIGTAYASRYHGVTQWPEGPGKERTWERLGIPPPDTEAWELHMMAVRPGYQRQGLAAYLMDLVDAEVMRRSEEGKKRVLFISTIKQSNEAFYLRRGFEESYSVEWPVGHMGSRAPFTVVHMDREIRGRDSDGS